MKKLVFGLAIFIALGFVSQAFADINWVNGYNKKDGTYVSGHHKDTSGDGDPYNNANYLGYND